MRTALSEDTLRRAVLTMTAPRTILSTTGGLATAIRRRVPPENLRVCRLDAVPGHRENIDGLEPASPIYNFRYPNMLRLRYEKLAQICRA